MCADARSRLDGLHLLLDIPMLIFEEHFEEFKMWAISVPTANVGTSENLTVCKKDAQGDICDPLKRHGGQRGLSCKADAYFNWPQPALVCTNMDIKATFVWDLRTLDKSSALRQARQKCLKPGYTKVPLIETHRKPETSCLIINWHL